MMKAIRTMPYLFSPIVMRFAKSAVVIMLAVLCGLPSAMAQSATTTTLDVTPATGASGSIFSLAAAVQSGGTMLTGGTVKFTDSYNGQTVTLGFAQVQSSNGTVGAADLKVALAGAGTHSITASFNGTSSYAASASSAQGVTITSGYPTAVTLGASGGIGNYTLTAALSGIGPGTPTGDLTFNDTTAGATLGTVALNTLSLTSGFGAQQTHATGSGPDAITVGDFNGDGKLDLAVANLNGTTISVLLGNGDGTFQTQVTYAVGSNPDAIAVGDFNEDGTLDLAVANYGSKTVSVLLGNGDGTFQTQVTYAVGSDPAAIVVGDFNGDGKLDLAVANYGSKTVSVLLGNGDGTFQTQVTYAVGSDPAAIVVGDFNGDGKLDLAVANYGSKTVSVLLGNGDGTFQTQVTYAVGSDPAAIVVGDFNGDGKLDLAVANYGSKTVSVLLGNGDGTFQTQVTYAVGSDPAAIVVGDFNGDGKLDLAVANYVSKTVSVLLGNGDGTFQTQVTYAVGSDPDAIAVGDFNGDGTLDLAVANEGSATVSVLAGGWSFSSSALTSVVLPGSGTQAVNAAYSGDSNFSSSTSASVNLAAGAEPTTTTTLSVNPAGDSNSSAFTFTAVVQASNGIVVSGGTVTFSDSYNGLTTTLGTMQVQTADGTAVLKVQLPAGSHSVTAGFGGLSSGSLSDAPSISAAQPVIVTGTYATSTVLASSGAPGNYTLTATVEGFGNGTPTGNVTFNDTTAGVSLGTAALSASTLVAGFAPQQTYALGGTLEGVAVGDFNGDGIPDLAVANYADSTVSVLLGNGDGTFQTQVTYAVGSDPYAIAVGDFNGDGKLDLAVMNYGGETVSVLLGNGDGTFQTQVTYAVGSNPRAIAVGDFNGDGKLDLAVANYAASGTVSVLLGNGDGTFQTQVTYAVGSDPDAIAVGDFNGDGKLDLAVANYGGETVSVLLGNGDGTFQTQVTYAAGSDPDAIAVGDFNGDGKLDLAVANSGDNTVGVLLGNGDGTFQTQVTYAVEDIPFAVAVGDFNGDGKLDLAVTNNAASSTVSVLLGNGDGTFQTQATYAVGDYPTGIAVGDFNGDGKADLAVANRSDGTVSVLLGEVTETATLTGVSVAGSGTHAVSATYAGDSNFSTSTASTVSLVASLVPATLTLTTTPTSTIVGQQVTLTATLNPYSDGTISTNGETVTFLNGTTTLGTGTLSSGVATFTTTALPVGTDSLTAVYAGDTSFVGATSSAVSYAVISPPTPTTTLSVSPGSAATGSIFTLTATVAAAGPAFPGGTVTFEDSYGGLTTTLGTAQVQSANGTAVLKTTLAGAGTHSITASIGGLNFYQSSASAAQTVTITGTYTTNTALAFSGTAGDYTLTATTVGLGRGAPTGNVAFNDATGGTTLGTAALNASTLASGFAAQQTYNVGERPEGVAVGDFNGDGIPDLAVANVQSGTVSILLGNGNGTFQTQSTFAATDTNGNAPQYIAVGDFNGDGKLDLALGTNVWLGNGDGTFTHKTSATNSGVDNQSPFVVGDFNGDGILDVATLGTVFLGNGDGTFQSGVNFSLLGGVNATLSVVEGDFNGDGKLDMAVTYLDPSGNYWLAILLGNGDGTFQTPVKYAYTAGSNNLAVADVNGDGKPDLVLAGAAQMGVLLGNGDGTFQAETTYPVGGSGTDTSVAVADFNGDGKLDVATAYGVNGSVGTVALLLGNGDGTFQAPVTYAVGTNPYGVAVGDFNGDGRPDVVATNSYFEGPYTVSVLLGEATETAALTGISIPGSGSQAVDAVYSGDTNFGGSTSSYAHLTGGELTTTLTLAASPTSTTPGTQVTLTATLNPYSNGSQTTNGEGVIFLNGATTLGTGMLSGGVATLATSTLPSGTDSITAIYAGDAYFSSSQSSPAVVTIGAAPPSGPTTTLSVTPASGATGPAFTVFTLTAVSQTTGGTAVTGGTVTFYDTYNGVTSPLGVVAVQTANGTAVLKTPLGGAGTHSLTASYGGDSIDQPSTSAAQTVTVTGLLSTTTALASSGSVGDYALTATVAGIGNGTPTGSVAFNDTSTGTTLGSATLNPATLTSGFGAPQSFTSGTGSSFPHGVAKGDFNGDGIPDLAVVDNSDGPSSPGTVSIFLGNGDGTFQTPISYPTGQHTTAVIAADLNGDGKLDLVVTNYEGATVGVLLGNGDGTFQPQVTYPTGPNPIAVTVGDFNGDGKPDLAVANFGENTVTILLGNGDGTFQPQPYILMGNEPMAVAVGDFNGDGKLDLAVGNVGDDTVGILLGNGDGTFQPQVAISGVGKAIDIAVADFNGDGKPDLAVANSNDGYGESFTVSNTISVLLGKGDGTFQPPVAYTTGYGPSAIAAADINKDGKLDLVVTNSEAEASNEYNGNTMSLLLGNGDGTFEPQTTYPIGNNPIALAVGDFNGDGRPDVAVQTGSPGTSADVFVSVALGEATETATLANVYVPGSGTAAVNATYTGDTLFTTSTSSSLTLAAGQIVTTLALTATPPAAAPGQQVVLTATLSPASVDSLTTDGATITFLNGTAALGTATLSGGVATFTTSSLALGANPITAVFAGAPPFNASTSQVNTVIIAPATATTLTVTPGSGATGSVFTLTAAVQVSGTAVSGGTVTFQDSYNGIIKTLGAVQVQSANRTAVLKTTLAGTGSHTITASFSGTGTGGASVSAARTVTLTGTYATTTALASSGLAGNYTLTATVTGYGNPTPTGNVAFNDTTGGIAFGTAALNPATLAGSFISPLTYPNPTSGENYGVVVGDFNGDGIPDIAVSNLVTNDVSILLGNGDGTFQIQATTYPTGETPNAIAVGDFNGDGKLDLVVTNYNAGTVSILLGNGDGTFQPQVTYTVGNTPYAVAVGDFNGDGKLDLAVASIGSNTIGILLGNGDGTFQPQQTFGSFDPVSIAVGDFNGDGKPDLAVASYQDNTVGILLGNGDGTFQTAVEYPAGTDPTTVFVGDFNGDGKQDLIAGNSVGASVLLGNGDGTFQPQATYQTGISGYAAAGAEVSTLAIGDINGDGKPDLVYVAGTDGSTLLPNGTFQPGGSIIVSLGNGDGTFQPPVTYAGSVVYPATIALGDFNGDGRLDLAIGDEAAGEGSSGAYYGSTDIELNVASETATLTGVSALGAQTVDAAYAGDTNFSGSTSATISLSAGIPTVVTVTGSASAIAPGQSVVLTATLVPSSSGSLTTNGETVTFLNGTTSLGTATLSAGTATLTTPSLSAGANSITAVYAGDATFGASTSPAFVVFVNSATATTLNVTPGTGATGSVFTLSATVQSGGTAVSSGTITFTDSYNGLTKTLGSAQIQASRGAAVLTTVLAGPGSHSITASYGGIAGSGPSISAAQAVTLSGLLNTATTLASSGTVGNYTLTATVTGYGNSTPTGSVTFSDTTGGVTLGTTALNSSTLISGFSAPQSYATGTDPGPVVVGDFNNDGISDLAVATFYGDSISVLLGNGDGTFQNQVSITVPLSNIQSIVTGDFNGDGKLDLAVMGFNSAGGGAIVVLLGNGDGTFQTKATYAVANETQGSYTISLAIGDFNSDGKLDLAVPGGTGGILLGNGDGTFQPLLTNPEVQGQIAAGDFNGDGKLDLAVAGGILLGNGDGTFQPLLTNPKVQDPVVGDFNGDGKLDLAVPGGTGGILLGNGDGTFQPELLVGVGENPVVGDFNGDGKLDLASAANADDGNSIVILYGNGDGTFVPSSAIYPDGSLPNPNTGQPAETSGLAVGDFNGDGKPDLVAIGFNNYVASVLLGQQLETATLTGVSAPGSGTVSVDASYSGDTNFGPSSSSPITLTTSQIATKLTLTANAPPSNSQQVTLVGVLTPASDGSLTTNGETVTFLTGTTIIGTATLSNGVATLVTTSIPAGATNLTASYPGDANFEASQSAATSVVLKAILLVTANSLTRQLNQPNPALTYTITGFVNGDTQSSATTGAPSLTTTATQTSPAGSYPITITQGTLTAPNYNLAFINGTLTVTGESQTLTFPPIANTIYGPTPIALNATASSSLPVTYTVTGSAAVSGSTLTLTGAGSVTVTANQVGSGTYAAATSVSQSFTVSPAVLTATASNVSRAYGVANPTLTYTLAGFVNSDTQASATTGTPSLTTTATQSSVLGTYPITIAKGTLAAQNYTFTFVNGTLTISGVPLTVSANNATRAYGAANPAFTGLVQGAQNGDTFTETFSTAATAISSPGTYPIVPTVTGTNLSDYTVTTVNGTLTIAQAPTTAALTASSGTSGAGSAVIFTAQVASSTTGTPAGTVSFYNNGTTLLGTGVLNSSGQATYTSSVLAIGSYSVTAAYSGDVNFTASTSPALTETIVQPGTFTLGSSPSNQTVSAGGVATYTITVSPSGAVTSPVIFSATGLPAGATATFSPASVSPGASPVSTTLTIQTGAQVASLTAKGKPGSHSQLAMLAMSLLMLPLFRVRAIGNRLGRLSYGLAGLLCFALSLAALIGLSGCGSGPGTPPSAQSPDYTITVTGTSGSLQQSTIVTLTIQ